jgi:glutaredoxin
MAIDSNITTLFTHPDCTYSGAKKTELDEDKVEYQEIDLGLHPDRWADLEEITGGERITPVFIGPGVMEIGYHGVG